MQYLRNGICALRAKARQIQRFNNDRTSSATYSTSPASLARTQPACAGPLKPKPKRHRRGLQRCGSQLHGHGSTHDVRASDATVPRLSYQWTRITQMALHCSGRGASRLLPSNNGGRSAESTDTRFTLSWCALCSPCLFIESDTVAARLGATARRCEARSAPLALPSTRGAHRFAAHIRANVPGNLRRAAQRSERVVERGSVHVSSVGSWDSARAREATHGTVASIAAGSGTLAHSRSPNSSLTAPYHASPSAKHEHHNLTYVPIHCVARALWLRGLPAECSACPRDRSSPLERTSGRSQTHPLQLDLRCFDASRIPHGGFAGALRQATPSSR